MAAENSGDLRAFTRDSLPEIDRTVREARGAADDLRGRGYFLDEDVERAVARAAAR